MPSQRRSIKCTKSVLLHGPNELRGGGGTLGWKLEGSGVNVEADCSSQWPVVHTTRSVSSPREQSHGSVVKRGLVACAVRE